MLPKRAAPAIRRSRLPLILGIVLGAVVAILAAIYVGTALHYTGIFLPRSSINGVDVSGLSVEEAEQVLNERMTDYALTLMERDGVTETITGDEIGLTMVLGDTVAQLLQGQNAWAWPLAVMAGRADEMTVDTIFDYDSDKLDEAISSLACLDSANAVAPTDAYLSGYDSETKSVIIVEETQGTLVDEDALTAAIRDAVEIMQTTLDLEEAGCYVAPSVTSDNAELLAQAELLGGYLGTEISYEMGDDTILIDSDELMEWLEISEDGTVSLDQDAVAAFVRSLASTYNTIFADRTFTTTYGETIVVEGGDYGWWMNESAEVAELSEQILSQESGSREPVWYSTAAVLGAGASGDYGDTYVEVDLTAQHLFYYKDGSLVIESDFVSGANDATPTGTYGILYCERYATLNGESYSSPVSYWMPFYNGVGLHDASWRTSFGGSIYKSSGSHGCINLPIKVAQTIYENISAGTAVIVYELEGTESTSTTSQSYEDIASAVVDALDEIASAGEITSANYDQMSKRIQWAQAAYSSLSSSAKALVTNYDLLTEAVAALEAYESANG